MHRPWAHALRMQVVGSKAGVAKAEVMAMAIVSKEWRDGSGGDTARVNIPLEKMNFFSTGGRYSCDLPPKWQQIYFANP